MWKFYDKLCQLRDILTDLLFAAINLLLIYGIVMCHIQVYDRFTLSDLPFVLIIDCSMVLMLITFITMYLRMTR
nr:MAG TPA: hypothetical protein [Caudoviricetes sp.]